MVQIPDDIKARLVDIFDEERVDDFLHEAVEDQVTFARINYFHDIVKAPEFVNERPDPRSGYYD